MQKELKELFEIANQNFLDENQLLIESNVSERTLCGALMLELFQVLQESKWKDYFVDVEYNRNKNGKIKTIQKKMMNLEEKIVTINCDLIVHSRGQKRKDNLIAIEMKKSHTSKKSKQKDKDRLMCLTKEPTDNIWSYGGIVFPDHVCGYQLGIYYEINLNRQLIKIEYYQKGEKYQEKIINFFGQEVNQYRMTS